MNRRFTAALIDISPLRESVPYRALWLGQIVSLMGSNMRMVAVAWQVFELTGSTVAVGLVGLAEVIPLIIFSMIGGALVDTRDRRRLIAGAEVGLMLTSGALAAVAFSPNPSVLLIYAITAIASALNAIDRPARSSLVPHLVPEGKLTAAMALRQVLFQTTTIIGPAIGGVLIGAFDLGWVYLLDALTFVAALYALRWVPDIPIEPTRAMTQIQTILEGLRFAARTPVLMSIFVIDLVAMIFGMPRAVFPALSESTFNLGPQGVGLLYAAPAVGALIGALTTGWMTKVRRQGLGVLLSVAAWGVAITLAGLATFSILLTVALLAVAGAADVFSAVFRGTILLERTPDPLLGRLNSLNIMVVTGGPRLGDVEAGLVAGLIGPAPSIVVGGLACLVGTGAVATWFPSLRRYTTQGEGTAAPLAS
ncbi:MAG TPA: MFS transporter [Actinomycetota bacterium]|nr:MFS transporter [Actinomycetota bacterium]